MKCLNHFFCILKSGIVSRRRFVIVKASKLVLSVLNLFYNEGFIAGFSFNPKNSYELIVFLKYINGKSFIKDCAALSVSGQRSYAVKNKNRFLNDGLFLMSTSKNGIVLSNYPDSKVGGEVLAQIFI